MVTESKQVKKSSHDSTFSKALRAVLTILCTLFALFVINRVCLCCEQEYDATHGYCEECYRELEIVNLISANNGNAWVCAQCIDEYTKCILCNTYYHNDMITDNLYCENCLDV